MTNATRSSTINRLTALQVDSAKEPGRYADGGGLFMLVSQNGRKRWFLRYTSPLTGKRREMALGPASGRGKISLQVARNQADDALRLVRQQIDPVEHRKDQGRRIRAETPQTFGAFAETWLDDKLTQFSNPKHRQQWRNTLTTYAAPIWNKPLAQISSADVLAIVKPIWTEKHETATRVRGRIERILDAATTMGFRSGDNPARWNGHLANLLPTKPKGREKHFAALPWKELPNFIKDLRQQEGIAALALEFTILTAARSGMVRGATWAEIDLGSARWSIPGERMKARRDHRVPLPPRALEILREMTLHRPARDTKDRALIFPGTGGRPLSDMSLTAVLRRMGRNSITVHGFRSTFRDWAEDGADAAYGTIRSALAHSIGDRVDAAYRRGDAFERRRKLMAEWESFMEERVTDKDRHDGDE